MVVCLCVYKWLSYMSDIFIYYLHRIVYELAFFVVESVTLVHSFSFVG